MEQAPNGLWDIGSFVSNMRGGKGQSFEKNLDKYPEAKQFILQELNKLQNAGRQINKNDIRSIEQQAEQKFNLPKSFDITSAGILDSTLAKYMNTNNVSKPADTGSTANKLKLTPNPNPDPGSGNTWTPELDGGWRERIRNAKATDADIQKAYNAWKAGRYTPGPKTLEEFKKLEAKSAAPAVPTESTKTENKVINNDASTDKLVDTTGAVGHKRLSSSAAKYNEARAKIKQLKNQIADLEAQANAEFQKAQAAIEKQQDGSPFITKGKQIQGYIQPLKEQIDKLNTESKMLYAQYTREIAGADNSAYGADSTFGD